MITLDELSVRMEAVLKISEWKCALWTSKMDRCKPHYWI